MVLSNHIAQLQYEEKLSKRSAKKFSDGVSPFFPSQMLKSNRGLGISLPNYLFIYYWHIYPPITRKRRSAVRARLGVAGHLSTTLRWGNPVKCLSQRHK